MIISTTFDTMMHSIEEGNIFLSVVYSPDSEVLAKPGKTEIFFEYQTLKLLREMLQRMRPSNFHL